MLGPSHLSFPIIHPPFHLLSILIYDSIISSVLRAHATPSTTGSWRGPVPARRLPPAAPQNRPMAGQAVQAGQAAWARQEGPGEPQVLTRWRLCPGRAGAMCSPGSPLGTVACTGAHTPCTGSAAPVMLPAGDMGSVGTDHGQECGRGRWSPAVLGDTLALAVLAPWGTSGNGCAVVPQHSGSGRELVCSGRHHHGG